MVYMICLLFQLQSVYNLFCWSLAFAIFNTHLHRNPILSLNSIKFQAKFCSIVDFKWILLYSIFLLILFLSKYTITFPFRCCSNLDLILAIEFRSIREHIVADQLIAFHSKFRVVILFRLRNQWLKDYHIVPVINGKSTEAHWNSFANWDRDNLVMCGKAFGIIRRQLQSKHSNPVSKLVSHTEFV